MIKSPADVTKQEAKAEDLAKTGMQCRDRAGKALHDRRCKAPREDRTGEAGSRM
jgi:hypothetical protein